MVRLKRKRPGVHSMKVTGTGGLSQTSGAKPARGGGGGNGFSVAGAQAPATPVQVSGAAGVSSVMGVQALLALQDVESPTERKRRSVRRAAHLLDKLDDLIAFLRVVDAGGFSAAERSTGIPKSSLSRRIAGLT